MGRIVKFLIDFPPYQAGEVESFSDEAAQMFIDADVAEEIKAYKPKKDKMIRSPKVKKHAHNTCDSKE